MVSLGIPDLAMRHHRKHPVRLELFSTSAMARTAYGTKQQKQQNGNLRDACVRLAAYHYPPTEPVQARLECYVVSRPLSIAAASSYRLKLMGTAQTCYDTVIPRLRESLHGALPHRGTV